MCTVFLCLTKDIGFQLVFNMTVVHQNDNGLLNLTYSYYTITFNYSVDIVTDIF